MFWGCDKSRNLQKFSVPDFLANNQGARQLFWLPLSRLSAPRWITVLCPAHCYSLRRLSCAGGAVFFILFNGFAICGDGVWWCYVMIRYFSLSVTSLHVLFATSFGEWATAPLPGEWVKAPLPMMQCGVKQRLPHHGVQQRLRHPIMMSSRGCDILFVYFA